MYILEFSEIYKYDSDSDNTEILKLNERIDLEESNVSFNRSESYIESNTSEEKDYDDEDDSDTSELNEEEISDEVEEQSHEEMEEETRLQYMNISEHKEFEDNFDEPQNIESISMSESNIYQNAEVQQLKLVCITK